MSEYTKGKWEIDPLIPHFLIRRDRDGFIAYRINCKTEIDARYIYLCCTSHDALLQVSNHCLAFCRGLVGKHPVAKILREELEAAIEAAKGVKK